MVNIFQKIKDIILGKLKKKEVVTEIDPESLKTKEEVMHLQKAYAYEKGRRLKAEQTISELTKEEEEDREEVARQLTEQREDILEKEMGVPASLKTILKFTRRRGKPIHVMSYNREKDFGILRDIGISPRGSISVYVQGVKRPIITGVSPQKIFRNCAGLKNDAFKRIISINLDAEGSYVANLEQVPVPQVVIDFNKKVSILSEDTTPFIERIIEKDNEISGLLSDVMAGEKTISNLTKELNDEKKRNEVIENEADSYKSDLSEAVERVNQMQRSNNKLIQRIILLSETSSINDQFIKKLEGVIEDLQEKASDTKSQTEIEKAIGRMRNLINWFQSIKPEVQVVPVETREKEETVLPKPVKLT